MTAAQVLATGVTKAFGDRAAVTGVDLRAQGGIVTLLGPNGAGKTTLVRCLGTVLGIDGGSLLVDGLDPSHESDRLEVRRRLGYLPQEPGFSRTARVFDVVDYVAVLRGLRDERRRRLEVADVLERVGLRDRIADRVADLSGGMRRRLGLAQALVGEPGLLLLDEPAAGLDPEERRRLREIVTERRHRATVVVSTHLTDEAAIGDQVVVLADGRGAFTGSPSELTEQARGRVWEQATEPIAAFASWQQADGSYRCVGDPPAHHRELEPTIEDGYLVVVASQRR